MWDLLGTVKNDRYNVITVCRLFILVFSASPLPRGVCPGVWHDRGGFWPAGSVEEKWAQEAGPTVLIAYGRQLNTAITRGRDSTDSRRDRGRQEGFYSVSLPWLRTCSRSPHMTNQILVTPAWTSEIPREGHRDIMHRRTDETVTWVASATVAACWSGV